MAGLLQSIYNPASISASQQQAANINGTPMRIASAALQQRQASYRQIWLGPNPPAVDHLNAVKESVAPDGEPRPVHVVLLPVHHARSSNSSFAAMKRASAAYRSSRI